MQTRVLGCMAALVLGLCAGTTSAVTVVECVDADGNSVFRDKCPPGTTKKAEKRLLGVGGKVEPTVEEIAKTAPITLYTVPGCDACDLVRSRLNAHKLPFTEKDVQDNAATQEEMKAATGGLTVPAIVIGKKILTGYSSDALDGALEVAGYPTAP